MGVKVVFNYEMQYTLIIHPFVRTNLLRLCVVLNICARFDFFSRKIKRLEKSNHKYPQILLYTPCLTLLIRFKISDFLNEQHLIHCDKIRVN